MLNMKVKYTGQWEAAATALSWLEKKALKSIKLAEKKEAKLLSDLLKKNIRDGGNPPFAAIKPFTRAIRRAAGRRGSKPLRASGNLMRLIKPHKVGDGDWFVGIRKGSVYVDHRGKTRDAVKVALLLENGRKGFVVALDKASPETGKTPRQWLWWLYFSGAIANPPSKGKTHMVISAAPPRPIVGNLFMQEKDKIRQRIIDRFIQEFNTVRVPSAISAGGTTRVPSFDLSF